MSELRLHHISKFFGNVQALKDISLKIPDGQFAILLGPSGCGKSTLLKIIAGLENQSSGGVMIDGKDVSSLSPRERDIAMVFQSYALYPHMSVRENLSFGLKMRKEPKNVIEARIQEAAELLDIGSLLDRKPRALSGGQRQRVAMGRAIVRKPRIFLFDEPLSNLDARLRISMRVELKKLHQRLGTTMIYVTHDQVEAMTLGQTIVIMDQGLVHQVDQPSRIYTAPANEFVASFIGSPPMNLIQGMLEKKEKGWHFRSEEWQINLPELTEAHRIHDGTKATLGIRPEDLLYEEERKDSLMKGTVEVVEDLGADRLIYVRLYEHSLVVRSSKATRLKSGDSILLKLPKDRLHLFTEEGRISF